MAKLKTKSQLLKDLKKANKVRKLYLANRAGFDTVDEYKLHLETGIKNDDSEKTVPTIHNVHILDTSASMGSLTDSKLANAIKGMQTEWLELSLDNNANYTNTLVTFHYPHKIKREFWKVPFSEIPKNPVTNHWGNTALYDAIYTTLNTLIEENNENDRVLVKIFTDGEENSSQLYTSANVNSIIRECKNLGITIIFVGIADDVRNVEYRLSVDKSNTLVHDNTLAGVTRSFKFSTASTQSYASAVADGATKEETLVGFYKQQEIL